MKTWGGSDDVEILQRRIAFLHHELERAYRAVQAFANAEAKGEFLSGGTLAYHAPTVAAAKRFVFEDALDGVAYFEGKPVGVLEAALRLPITSRTQAQD